MGSGGYVKKSYQNDKYERYNYDNFIATDIKRPLVAFRSIYVTH